MKKCNKTKCDFYNANAQDCDLPEVKGKCSSYECSNSIY